MGMISQRGNILFLILLAVVLFAALSYAVTNSLRGGGKNASSEDASVMAAQFMGHMAQVENTVTRMTMSGVKPEHLDFRDTFSGNGANSNCATPACRVFHVDGGGMRAMSTPVKALCTGVTYYLASNGEARSAFLLISVKNIGTSLADIVMIMRGVNDDICNEINVKAGVYSEGSAAIADDFGVGNSGGSSSTQIDFEGNMDPFPSLTADVMGDADARIAGKTTFCFLRGAEKGNYIVHVLYPR